VSDTDGMLTIAQAAQRINRSVEHVRRCLRAGKIKGRRIGNHWFVEEASLNVRRQPAGQYLIPREVIEQVRELREEITRRNRSQSLDVLKMLKETREGR
jgi:excisionase family DNA binding protein